MTFNGVWDYFRIPTICTDLVTFLGICGAGESLDDAWFKLTGTSCSRWPSYSSNGGFRKWRIPKETIQTWSFFGKPTAKPTGISVESPAEVRRIRPPWNPDAPSRAVLAVRARAYRALALGCWKDEFSRPPVPCLGTSFFWLCDNKIGRKTHVTEAQERSVKHDGSSASNPVELKLAWRLVGGFFGHLWIEIAQIPVWNIWLWHAGYGSIHPKTSYL